MRRYKSLVLPIALVGGYFLRHLCADASFCVPYLIFAILIMTFSGVRLVRLRPAMLDLCIASFQIIAAAAGYLLTAVITSDEVLAQGVMICALCPVASSVTVVASMLEANAVRTTVYTIVGNLMVAVAAPLFITLIKDDGSFIYSCGLIFCKIGVVIALPFFVVLLLQKVLPKLNDKVARYRQASFYLWAMALFITIGQTADFVVERWNGDVAEVMSLGFLSLFMCVVQFAVGRLLGRRFGDKVAGGQLAGQKNSAMGIWIINTFLNPMASVAMAFYSIWQNILTAGRFIAGHRKINIRHELRC